MADDVAVMYCGQVVEKAPVGHIFGGESKYSHPYTEGLLSSIPALSSVRGERLEAIPGSVPHPFDLPEGCRFAPRCKYATEKCVTTMPELEPISENQQVRCYYPEKGVRSNVEDRINQ